jgi:putative peptide zinc metalloprotease protein
VETHPKFRADLKISEPEKGNSNIIIKDPVTDKYYRVSSYEYGLLSSLDGAVSVDEAIEKLKYDGYHYSQPDAQMILGKAAQSGLLLGTRYGTSQFQNHLKDSSQKAGKEARASRLYFTYIPLVNPDRFLEKTLWIFRRLVNRWTVGLAALLAPGALYVIITRFFGAEQEYLYFFNIERLLYLWTTIVIAKLVHELAHAYTAKHFGLRVPQMGIAFLIFFPCLYCNTTAAWELADRRQRMAISAAGILAEVALALIATYIYHFTRPGMINSLAYYLVAVSLISTILFNANPLIKFDGYFILIDLLDRPNLAANSKTYLKYLFMNRILGISIFTNPAQSREDVLILSLYGFCSSAYRVVLYTGIVVGVYYRFNKFLGIMLAATAFVIFLVKPIRKFFETLYKYRKEIHPKPANVAAGLALLGLAFMPLVVPITTKSVYPCYLEAARIQKITVPLGASVKNVCVRERAPVDSGTLLFQLDTTLLSKSIAQKEIDREITNNRIKLDLLDDKNMAKASERRIQLAQFDHEIRLMKQDLEMAEKGIIAPFDGVITRLDPGLQEGFQTVGGAIVGELKSHRDCVINVLIPEEAIEDMAWGQDVKICLHSFKGELFSGKIADVRSFSERDLKDSPFSSRHGGDIPTEAKDHSHLDSPLVAQYIASVKFSNDDLTPLMTTGRCAVSSVPRSILGRFYYRAMRTLNRETLL